MNVKLITFWTPRYCDDAAMLKATAAEFGLWVHDIGLNHEPGWAKAVMMKPQFILDRLLDLEPGYDGVLWVDADARFRAVPDWSKLELADFACHWFQRGKNAEPELLTGTLWFAKTRRAVDLARAWVDETPRWSYTDTPEQKSLAVAFGRLKETLISRALGPEWTFIHDDSRAAYPGVAPVIEHMQRSRDPKVHE